jgi:TetR/AcrR family tetracycline transcriptional repressor
MAYTTELALTEITAAGYSLEAAAQAVVTLLHFTTGCVIEEQARTGIDYAENLYTSEVPDPQRYPPSAKARACPEPVDFGGGPR